MEIEIGLTLAKLTLNEQTYEIQIGTWIASNFYYETSILTKID
jgi:hypothetical protein